MLKIPAYGGKFKETASVAKDVAKQTAGNVSGEKNVDVSFSRPASSFKIKDSLRQLDQSQSSVACHTEVSQQKVDAHDPLEVGRVGDALKAYVTARKPGVTVEVALTAHHPSLERDKITVFADNQLQLKELESLKGDIRSFLMECLNNGCLVCEFKLFSSEDAQEEKKLFTSSEKLEHFREINPVVDELKHLFGLELE